MKIPREDRLLLACLGGDGPLPASPDEWEDVLHRSIRHGVSPYLYSLLRRSPIPVPEETRRHLHHLYLEGSAANTGLYHDLAGALSALKGAGISVIVLKGGHLAEVVYENIALRPMGDIDLMFRIDDLDRAQRVLLDAGYPPQGERLPIDLHWGLSLARKRLTADIDEIWRRAEPAVIAGVGVLVLSPEDLLVHLCTHLSFQHLFESAGVRTLIDIRETVRHYGSDLNWEMVRKKSCQWNNRNGVHLTLLLAHSLVGANVPDEFLEKLKPGDYDGKVLDWAMAQIFTDYNEGEGIAISPYFWQLWKNGSLAEKARNFRNLVLPPREFISQKYPVNVRSGRSFLYYAVRLGDHFTDYGRALWKIAIRDKTTLARAERANRNIAMRDHLVSR